MNIQNLNSIAKTVRALSVDAVERSKSGHPGLPLGMAEFGAWLYGELLSHNPVNPGWTNRDRFVLSAGHGSMFLYSLLYLCGYDLSLDEIKRFRQLNSLTPGHPEYGHTAGVETTTGPLGQGFANAVGMAIAQSHLAEVFNTDSHTIVDHYIYSLMGDGCIMEGISTEAASLAGHLKLGRLIAFYDSNNITIEGSTELAFSEDVAAKYRALGWHVQESDAYDIDSIRKCVESAKKEKNAPSFIILNSLIGKGAPNKAGTSGIHGAALGSEELAAFRAETGVPMDRDFYIVDGVEEFFVSRRAEWQKDEDKWKVLFEEWEEANSDLAEKWRRWHIPLTEKDFDGIALPEYQIGDSKASRVSSGDALQVLADVFENLVGGSADLAPSNNTMLKKYAAYSPSTRGGRNFHFGVREHAMGGVASGMVLYGGLQVYSATFLVFSDYMRPSVRLAALMNLPQIYVFTHDSIYIGEDGPTHQPVEHLSALRAIPNLQLFRPADGEETNLSWKVALLRGDGPVAFALTRQGLNVFSKPSGWEKDFEKGAYIAKEASGKAGKKVVLVATGSEVNLSLEAAATLEADGYSVQVVSMPCRERFYQQDESFVRKILLPDAQVFVAEAGISQGWEGVASSRRHILRIDRFGLSAKGVDAAKALGITPEALVEKVKSFH